MGFHLGHILPVSCWQMQDPLKSQVLICTSSNTNKPNTGTCSCDHQHIQATYRPNLGAHVHHHLHTQAKYWILFACPVAYRRQIGVLICKITGTHKPNTKQIQMLVSMFTGTYTSQIQALVHMIISTHKPHMDLIQHSYEHPPAHRSQLQVLCAHSVAHSSTFPLF